MVSEIFRTLGIGWAWHDSGSALESGISNFKLSCKTIYQYTYDKFTLFQYFGQRPFSRKNMHFSIKVHVFS